MGRSLLAVLPDPWRRWLRAQRRRFDVSPPRGFVRFGSLRRLAPISRHWGFDRGQAIDRYYIERFLARHAADIRGRVLEIAEDTYTRRYGGDRVERCDVLYAEPGNPRATIVGDLTRAEQIPSDQFDCVVLTQTVQMIYDVRAVLRTVVRILKPGGVLLATASGISKVSLYDMDRWGEYWRLTSRSAARLVEEAFGRGHARVEAHGNVLVAVAFLHGLAAEELTPRELDYHDPAYEVLVTMRAVKP